MPQSTNLNVNPYYDDFNEDDNYYRVLFKPGVTVQTRELNNLQSILQGQIEKFGSKFFTNGGIVIPGNFGYDGTFNCVEIENSYKGVSVETYFENFVGKSIKGRTTGIIAKIEYVLSSSNPEATRNTTAIYVKYQSSSSEDFTTEFFEDGEELVTVEDVYVGETLFSADSAIFRTLSPSDRLSTSVGSAAKIEDGVYFIRGTFVNIEKSTIILDAYTNTPSYRVGLRVVESIIDSDEDSSLVDNARGFSNYAAPGADRLKIQAFLTKKELDDYDDDEFIELFRVNDGVLIKINQNDPYAFITDVLARRTYDESGNYSVQPVNVTAIESLNDNLGNGGQYLSTQTTSSGQTPSNDLAVLKISPGKSYVKGYEVPTSTTLVDYLKPRTTKLVESSSSNFRAGNLLKVNNITGIPQIGVTTDTSIFLYKTRLDSSNLPIEADKIGVCRLYDFEYDNTSYENPSSQSNVYMFDIQTYTKIQTSSVISGITTGDYVQGNYSDASGYISTHLNDSITLYQVSGRFIKNEPLSICGISTTSTVGLVTDYSIQDIKSISDSDSTFTADSSLTSRRVIDGPFDLVVSGSTATITRQDGTSFATELKLTDIISYSVSGQTLPAYAEVISIISSNSISVSLSADVQNVCTNTLGTTGILPSINLLRSQIKNYNDSSFYAPLEKSNISEVSFLNSSIFVKKYYDGLSISGNSMTLPSLVATDFVYAPFDEERYCLVNSDTNQNIELTEENLIIASGGKTATLTSLPVSSANAKLITTQIKSNISSKYKKLERCKSVTLSRTKYNPVPSGSGLSYSRVYGTRVEDNELSLNYPDIFEVHGVFQSTTSSDPVLPSLTISGVNSADINLGEVFIGQTSGAVAICAEKLSSSSISFVYKSKNIFTIGEQIQFLETENIATITNSDPGEQNILSEFAVDNGQRKYFYDIGKLIRKDSTNQESRKIKIIFDYFKFETTDFGDIISVNSYPSNLYGEKLAIFDDVRNTDVIDIRPRVLDYNTSSTTSPFEYASRNFATGSNNPTQVLSSNESVIFDFNYYLPRTDKLTLDRNGNFGVVFGDPSDSPIAPTISEEVLDIATIRSPAYVFNTSDIEIELTNNRRYTMSDIKDIDKRVENLEFYTSLSLLEVATQNLLIEDQDGFNRFKCGFFVDNFSSDEISDTSNELYNARLQNNTLSADIEETHVGIVTTTTTNAKITGKTLTLNYSEIEYQKQNFASRIVNVNPFNIVTWSGNLTLSPNADRWEEIIRRTKRKRGNRRDRTVTSSVPIKYIRSRNIGFTGIRLKPRTQYDFIFDSKNLTNGSAGATYAFPKLVGISNVNGTFSIGETVKGYDSNGNRIKFKLCSPNHKSGPIANPTLTYTTNPYSPSSTLPSLYGPESTVLNVDTDSLQTSSEGDLFGNITVGMTLYGEQSNAFATVSSIKLITDENGLLSGSMFIPPATDNGLKYETGNTTAKLTTTQPLLGIPGEVPSTAETNFVSEGNLVTLTRIRYYDPLAQTFSVSEEEGVFITSVDVFFQSKDAIIPVELQIREVSSGIPGGPDKIVKNLSKALNPDQIQLSNDGTKATNFKFDNLTRLEGGREYAVVLISDSNEYNVWISRLGEVEISTAALPDVQKVVVNKQPSLGSLFKSQNGTTWVPSPEDDLKFTLKRAEFSTSGGTAIFTNSIIPSAALQNNLPANPLVALSTNAQSPYNDGRHIRVHHPNHGMYSENNYVTISGVMPDALPVNLDSTLPYTSAASITISDASTFGTFDGSAIDPVNNPGYILVNDEIIKYTGVSGNQLTGITRAQFGTTAITHSLNSKVYKYEFNETSLVAINTTFEGIIDPTIDHYYVQISSDFETFTADKIGGGDNVYATKNIQFSSASVNEDLIETYPSTSVLSSLRTVSSTSVDGSEVSFADNGYQEISIDSNNRFDTPRMVCSRVNELEYLPESQFNNSKSLFLQLNLRTENSKVSPVINLDNATVVVQNYRINQPIESYTTDSRINSNTSDPNAFIHFSKRINLNTAATSLKIFLTAYRHYSSDIRVLYKLFRDDNVDEDQNWQLFPGYLNLDVNNRVIDPDNNDGSSDEFVPESLLDEYREYTFSADNLPSFTGYAIKIVGTTNNQAYSPLIKDLRAIALK